MRLDARGRRLARPVATHLLAALGGGAFLLAAQFFHAEGRKDSTGAVRGLNFQLEDGGVFGVRRVVDGDTLVLDNGLHVRYAGINTPELGKYLPDPAPLGEEARARNRQLVEGRRVRLRFTQDPLDAHGRLIARIFVLNDSEPVPGGGEAAPEVAVAEVLVREGLARAMGLGLPSAEYKHLKELQDQAKAQRNGLWGLEDPLKAGNPRGYRYCASSQGDVFHLVDSPHAARISGANFVGYRTLQEAVASGRRLSAQCISQFLVQEKKSHEQRSEPGS